MSTCVHFSVVRKTATKGPNPVWMSATKNTSQSRARLLGANAVSLALDHGASSRRPLRSRFRRTAQAPERADAAAGGAAARR